MVTKTWNGLTNIIFYKTIYKKLFTKPIYKLYTCWVFKKEISENQGIFKTRNFD